MILTPGQAEIVRIACQGHNLLATGQAGTGKSVVVNVIISNLRAAGRRVSVVCSSGIACTVYEPGVASTVHSFYGLGTADLPWKKLVERSLQNSIVVNNLRKSDVIIWDEASMSSQRMLELANVIHHRLSDLNNENKPFGGKQVILVGEFLQLRPVPSDLDEGIFMYNSAVFQHSITHRLELTEVVRQVNKELLSALQDIRLGRCTPPTEEFLCTLSRSFGEMLESQATHIYFKKLPVLLHNRQALQKLPNPEFRFEAEHFGKHGINWPCSSVLHLRHGCPVMLVWNLNNELKNGSQGLFEECIGDKIKVSFPNVGSVLLERQTWYKVNRDGKVVGSICQFPIVLAYAITCHKSQGLTLPAAVVHCSSEFVPGLTYVAISRVRDPVHLQVINFQGKHLLPQDPRVIKECSTDLAELEDDLTCCRNSDLPLDTFTVQERYSAEVQNSDEGVLYPLEFNDGLAASYFVRDDDQEVTDIIDLYNELARPESELSMPPESIVLEEMLASMKVTNPLSEFAAEKNRCLEQLEKEETATTFVQLIWHHLYDFFKDHIIENADEVIVNIARGGFFGCAAKLHTFFNSDLFKVYLKALFNDPEVTSPQMTVATELTTILYEKFLGHLVDVVSRNHEGDDEPTASRFDVSEMSGPGKAKVRHVGGWAVRKVLENERRYARDHMHTKDEQTLRKVAKSVANCDLIEETLLVPYAKLEISTSQPETLEVTEARQFRERGLVHISDACFLVFLHLEQLRVNLMNSTKLLQHKQDLVTNAFNQMMEDAELKILWHACFPSTVVTEKQGTIDDMLKRVVEKYVNMGGSQFLRDYRMSVKLKKTAELRKRVMEKCNKRRQQSESVPFKEILSDRSIGKSVSNGRLVSFVLKHKFSGLAQIYTKPQLLQLCEAFGIARVSRLNKPNLAKRLALVISTNQGFVVPGAVDSRVYSVVSTDVDETSGRICVRLSSLRAQQPVNEAAT